MSDYLTWYDKMRRVSIDRPGQKIQSANDVKIVALEDGPLVLLKTIRPEVIYIPRLKILGELAYSLFDYHLNPGERVTPNICPVSENTLWRQFIRGLTGDVWRGLIYSETNKLESADLAIVNQILDSRFAQRIALLDFIFLCQDRSARNWIKEISDNRFWAIDNGMFWPYRGRHADKETVRTGKVNHLNDPMEAIVSRGAEFSFGVGVFSSLHAGRQINDGLLAWLFQLDWRQYFQELTQMIGALNYPFYIVDDWRFAILKHRADWLLEKRRFPTAKEIFEGEWRWLIDRSEGSKKVWKIEWEAEWEIKSLES